MWFQCASCKFLYSLVNTWRGIVVRNWILFTLFKLLHNAFFWLKFEVWSLLPELRRSTFLSLYVDAPVLARGCLRQELYCHHPLPSPTLSPGGTRAFPGLCLPFRPGAGIRHSYCHSYYSKWNCLSVGRCCEMSFGDDQICGHSTTGNSTAGGKTIVHAAQPV